MTKQVSALRISENVLYIRPYKEADAESVEAFLAEIRSDEIDEDGTINFIVFNSQYQIIGLYDDVNQVIREVEERGLLMRWAE